MKPIIVPAAPGFFTLFAHFDDVEGHIYRDPIIAWEIDINRVEPTRPVIPFGDITHRTILYPDGTVRSVDNSWDSVDEWFAEMREQDGQ